MTTGPEQLQTGRASLRLTLGGVSVLLVVALVLQATSGLADPLALSGQPAQTGTNIRTVAQVAVRHVRAVVRRQQERPSLVARGLVAAGVDSGNAVPPPSDPRVLVRCLGPWLTDLPPPAA